MLQRHCLAARQRMLARYHCAEAEPLQGDLAQVRRMAERHGDADVGLAAAQGLEHVRRSLHLGGEADAAGAAAVRGDQVRQHRFRQRLDAGDADGAAPVAGQGRDVRAEAVEVLEHVHDMPGQHLADRRQRQAARSALEQGGSNLLLELENLAADRRGGNVQDARRGPDRAGAADGVEVLDGR
ncbi:hypothetical protein ACVIHC_000209 [Bradyrhizobium diazoefficiens]